jgi:hypothetical protein
MTRNPSQALAILSALFLSVNAFSDANDLDSIEQHSANCAKNLEAALKLGMKSDERKNFEADIEKIRAACRRVQKDINDNKLGINVISDANFIAESFGKIKKMKQFALDHYLYDDIKHAFTELDLRMKDVRETGLYVNNPPAPVMRSKDYMLELEYLLEKFSKQNDEVTFYKIKGSRILATNESAVSRVSFLAGKTQDTINARGSKIPPLSPEANIMVTSFRKIVNNVTDKNPKNIAAWKEAIENMKSTIRKAKEEGIESPVK